MAKAKKSKKDEKSKEGKENKKVDPAKVQAKAKEILLAAKTALTDYLKKNKLSRDEDYSKDKKHGAPIKELTLAISKASDAMDSANKLAGKEKSEKKESKGGGGGKATKYDYPAGLSADEKKQFRIKARKEANGKGDKKAKSEDKAKDSKKSKKEETKAPVETKKVTSKEKSSGDKKKKKKSKKND